VLLAEGSWWRQIEEHLDEEIMLLGEGIVRTWARKKIERDEEEDRERRGSDHVRICLFFQIRGS
jgi:hypothetical protein